MLSRCSYCPAPIRPSDGIHWRHFHKAVRLEAYVFDIKKHAQFLISGYCILYKYLFFFTVPEQGPWLHPILKESESVQVKWSKIPQSKIRGCLRKYSIYLEDDSKNIKHYSKEHIRCWQVHIFYMKWFHLLKITLCLIVGVDYTKKQYTISGLSPGQCYKLWGTAWTDAGEGPRGIYLPVCTPKDCMCLFVS